MPAVTGATVVEGGTLGMEDARQAMGAVMDGEATPAQLAALLMGLRMRGETVEELAGFAAAMRERVTRVEAPDGSIDIVGTGGDGSGTLNISTTAALVVAAAGIPLVSPDGVPVHTPKDLKDATRAVLQGTALATGVRRIGLNGNCQIITLGSDPADLDLRRQLAVGQAVQQQVVDRGHAGVGGGRGGSGASGAPRRRSGPAAGPLRR